MRTLLLALVLFLPFSAYSAVPAKLTYKEYSSEVQKMAAECAAKSMPHFSGMCVTEKYGGSTATALTVSSEVHRFERYLERCENSHLFNGQAAQNYAFKIAKVKMFYEEMAIQTDALELNSRYSNDCKTVADNDAEIARRLRWFADMSAKYSDEATERAVQAQKDKQRQQSLAEIGLRETDPWFEGKFSGPFFVSSGAGKWSLKCTVGEACALTMTYPNSQPQTIQTRVPIRRETVIPNNNLRGTREVVRERPELYEDKLDGPMLVPLRDLLTSQAGFEHCVDIAFDADMALCSLTTDPRATNSLVMLVGTMKGSCGRSPFCAYYYQILVREK